MTVSRRTLLAVLPASALAALGGCAEASASAVSVLVDLSETWNNPGSREINERALCLLGEGIVAAVPSLPPPLSLRYHAIGTASLGKPPLCAMDFRHALKGFRHTPGVVTDLPSLKAYLTVECPQTIAAMPSQPDTEIAAALISADRAIAILGSQVLRKIIILSDFKEESLAAFDLGEVHLRGVHVLMLYRTLPEDRRDPAPQTARLATWSKRLRKAGAAVRSFDDNAITASAIRAQLEERDWRR